MSGYSELQNAEYKSIPVLHEQMSRDGDSFKSFKEVGLKNFNRIVLVHLNINSLRNKCDTLVEQVSGNVQSNLPRLGAWRIELTSFFF